MTWPADLSYLHMFFILLFQQVLLPVTLSVCETNTNSTLNHCFFGGSSEFVTDFSIPVLRPPPPNFDYSSSIVSNVKIFGSSEGTIFFCLFSCLLLHHLLLAFIICLILQHFRELTKRSGLSLIRHQKISALHFIFLIVQQWNRISMTIKVWMWKREKSLTIQNSSIGHHFMIFGTSGIKYYQVKCAVFLEHRKIYFAKELSAWNMLHQNPFLFLTIAWQCCSFFNPHFNLVLFRFIFLFPPATEQR